MGCTLGSASCPYATSLTAQVVARLLSLPPDFWRGFVETEQENLVPVPAPRCESGEHRNSSPHPPWPSASLKGPGCPWLGVIAVPTLSCRIVLPAHCLSRAQARPAEPSWCLLPSQHPAELRGHCHPAPVSAVGRGREPRGAHFVPLTHLSPRRQGPAPRKVGRFFPSPV